MICENGDNSPRGAPKTITNPQKCAQSLDVSQDSECGVKTESSPSQVHDKADITGEIIGESRLNSEIKVEPTFLMEINSEITAETTLQQEDFGEIKVESKFDQDSFDKVKAEDRSGGKESHNLKQLPCFLCNKIFTSKKDLMKHIRWHRTEKGFACPQCEKYFRTKESIARHINTVHKKLKPFSCSICSKSFARKTHLDGHVNTVHGNVKRLSNPYTCVVCQKSLACDRNMARHMRIHRKERPYSCPQAQCEKHFYTKDSMEKHVRTVHQKLREFPCNICDKSFSDNYKLNRHVNVVHMGLKDYGTPLNKNPNQTKSFPCTFCDKLFVTNGQRKRHVDAVHHKLKPFSCTLCDKSFATKAHLERHTSFHSQEKPFHCNLCQKHFYTKDCVRKHINRVHKRNETTPCKHCGKLFDSKWECDRHVIDAHGNSTMSNESELYTVPETADQQGDNHNGVKVKRKPSGKCLTCLNWFDPSELENHMWSCQVKVPCMNRLVEKETELNGAYPDDNSEIKRDSICENSDNSPHKALICQAVPPTAPIAAAAPMSPIAPAALEDSAARVAPTAPEAPIAPLAPTDPVPPAAPTAPTPPTPPTTPTSS